MVRILAKNSVYAVVIFLNAGCTFNDMRAVPDPLQVPVASVAFPAQMIGYGLTHPRTRRDRQRDQVAGYVTKNLEHIKAELDDDTQPHLQKAMEMSGISPGDQKKLVTKLRKERAYYFNPKYFIEGKPTPLIMFIRHEYPHQ